MLGWGRGASHAPRDPLPSAAHSAAARALDFCKSRQFAEKSRLRVVCRDLSLCHNQVLLDKMLYLANNVVAQPLPAAVQQLRGQYGHHLVIEAAEFGGAFRELRTLLPEHARYRINCHDIRTRLAASTWHFHPALHCCCWELGARGGGVLVLLARARYQAARGRAS